MPSHTTTWKRYAVNQPEWAIRPFPHPRIISTHDPYCGCTWVHSVMMAGSEDFPFILKFPWRMCAEHRKDYFE